MQQISYSEARQHLAKVLEETQNGPVTVTRNGKPAAVILSHDDFAHYRQYQENQLKQEFDRLMQRHQPQMDALADR